ncbi:AzlC family ABC transporter permease [Acidisoma silvae]|uniref:AzlC family ABC transporter permease n=1 Tax=Acidisoma silvae TaxID=2802396 RepID=A0A964E105_9PROT|nr:AzlC family ABC transporter permease [Acidisoma silvae]MCB8877278.1 AzlC family ABC transporter permease [Acidisoma silvae]
MTKQAGFSPTGLLLLTLAVALFGIAYGADSYAEGGGVLGPVLTSFLVQGGASQIASQGVLRSGGSALAAILVGMALNLRFMALALAIAPDLPKAALPRMLAAYLISDIPVGVALTQSGPSRGRLFILVGILAGGAWVGGTLIGTLVGAQVDVAAFGANGAIIGAFVALAMTHIRNRRTIAIALCSFAATIALMLWVSSGISVLGGAACGLIVERLWPPLPKVPA